MFAHFEVKVPVINSTKGCVGQRETAGWRLDMTFKGFECQGIITAV